LVEAVRSVVPGDADPRLGVELERFLRHGEVPQSWSLSAGASAPADGWRRLLSGQKSDLAECGDRPLDEWTAALVGACLGYDATAIAALRRALRKRGVAAFGMLG
jgi:hypothetical protein